MSKFPFPKGERQKGGLCEGGEYKKVEDKSKTKKEVFFSSSLLLIKDFFNDNDTKVEHIHGGGGIYKGVGPNHLLMLLFFTLSHPSNLSKVKLYHCLPLNICLIILKLTCLC